MRFIGSGTITGRVQRINERKVGEGLDGRAFRDIEGLDGAILLVWSGVNW